MVEIGVAPVKPGAWDALQNGTKNVEIINMNLTRVPKALVFYHKGEIVGHACVDTGNVVARRMIGKDAVEKLYQKYAGRLGMLLAELKLIKFRRVVTILTLTKVWVLEPYERWPKKFGTPQSGIRFRNLPATLDGLVDKGRLVSSCAGEFL